MSSAYVHKLIAKKAAEGSERIREAVKRDEALYYLGAQGFDFAFFCPKKNGQNVGRLLHRKFIYPTFSSLLSFCRKDESSVPYALGICSHYAADVIFHGYIYPAVKGSKNEKIAHAALERAMERYFAAKNGERPDYSFLKISAASAKKISSALLSLPVKADFSPEEIGSGFKKYRLYLNAVSVLLPYRLKTGDKKKWEELFLSSAALSTTVAKEFLSRLEGGELDGSLFKYTYLGDKI